MNNVTLIDDLPSLDELEINKSHGLSMIPQTETHKYQKFIRNSGYNTPEQAGMQNDRKMHSQYSRDENAYTSINSNQYAHDNLYNNVHINPHNNPHSDHINTPHMADMQNIDYMPENTYETYERQPKMQKNVNKPPNKPYIKHHNCIDVAEHTHNCLVCSKLYTNNNTLYILIIVFLAIVNLLLLKRILDVEK